MKISFETRIKVNGMRWVVSFVYRCPNEKSLGQEFADTCHIYIEDDILPAENMRRTVFHEIAHAFVWSYGFSDVTLNEDILCEFMAVYSSQIGKLTDKVLAERGKHGS